jgi:hypothetical protein
MAATVVQKSFEIGAELGFRASLTEYDLPVELRAAVEVELSRPGGSPITISMVEVEPGIFEASASATVPGVYTARFLAKGVTLRGTRFTREYLANAAVWRGGDQTHEPPRGKSNDGWNDVLACILGSEAISEELRERLKSQGLNLDALQRCIDATRR